MKIQLSSIMVDDQEKALKFYTGVLGFVKKTDIKNGDYRWLTVVSPEGVEGMEFFLESTAFSPSKVYQKALFDAGIPVTIFFSTDIQAEYSRLLDLGVKFRNEPQNMGPNTTTFFEDTCGNLINLSQLNF